MAAWAWVPFAMWAATLVVGAINCYIVCSKIEKTGEERLGATGHLFKYKTKGKTEKGDSK